MEQETVKRAGRRPLMYAAVATASLALFTGLAQLSTPAHSQDSLSASAAATFAAPVSFADVVERVSPAVVDIAVESVATVMPTGPSQYGVPLPEGSPFEDFFGQFFGAPGLDQWQGQGQAPMQRRRQGLGTGFVVDPDGYIVTNNHVIDGADQVTVRFNNGETYRADVVGRDPKTDLALIKVNSVGDLPFVELGDSDSVRIGDWVMAIGNPFGLGGSATVGIVSARGRDIQSGPYDDYMQIDAAINSGNSGGPVFNAAGEVVGISTAIFSPNGGNIGIGFAIPANQAAAVIEPLRVNGSVERGWLGVEIQNIDDDLASALGMDSAHGALVSKVTPGSPAARGGLGEGDLIVRVDDQAVDDTRHLVRLVTERAPGTELQLDVQGPDGAREVSITLGNAESPAGNAGRPEMSSLDRNAAGETALGLQLGDLTAAARRELNMPSAGPSAGGALVRGVAPDSPAAGKGLASGDVIVEVNRRRVESADEALAELGRARDSGRSTLLLVRRGDSQRYVAIGPA